MSHQAGIIAAELELPTAVKVLLLLMAVRACPQCGLTWLGNKGLMRSTGLGETRLRESLATLIRSELVKIHAYPHGGRGRATEYVVLPLHTELSTAPCGECRSRMKTTAPRAGFEGPTTEKPRATRGDSAKPRATDRKTPYPGTTQQEVTAQQEGAASGAGGVSPYGLDGGPSAILSAPPPRNAQEALQALDRMQASLLAHVTPEIGPARATAAVRGTANGIPVEPETASGKIELSETDQG